MRILDREEDWYWRGVREVIHIRRSGSNLNRDQGHHDLPVIYNKVLAIAQNQSIPVGQSGQVAIQAEKTPVAKEDLWMQVAGYHSSVI